MKLLMIWQDGQQVTKQGWKYFSFNCEINKYMKAQHQIRMEDKLENDEFLFEGSQVLIKPAHLEIFYIHKALENIGLWIQNIGSHPTVLEVKDLQQLLKEFPNIYDIKKRTLQLMNFFSPATTAFETFEELLTQLKKNEKQQNSIKSLSSYLPQKNPLHHQYFDENNQNMLNVDFDEKNLFSPSEYQIQDQHNKDYYQQNFMKRGQQGYWKNENGPDSFIKPSDISCCEGSNVEGYDLPMFSIQGRIDLNANEGNHHDDPLSNIKKYKIQEDRNAEDWNQADTTMSKIKQILFTFPQDSHAHSQIKIDPQQMAKLKKSIESSLENETNYFQVIETEKENLHQPEDIDTLEQQSSKTSHHQIKKMTSPALQICSKTYEISLGQIGHCIQQSSQLSDSKIEQEAHNPFIGTQSMIDSMSIQIGAPIYVLNDNQSEGNKTDRQMYMQQKLNLCLSQNNTSIKEFHDPVIEISEFYEMREKLIHIQQQKNDLFDQLRSADHQIKTLREELGIRKQIINQLQSENQTKNLQHELHITNAQKQLTILQQSSYTHRQKILQQEQKISQLIMEKEQIRQNFKEKQLQMQELQIQNIEIKDKLFTEIDNLNHDNSEKLKTIKQLEQELQENRNQLKLQIFQMAKVNDELRKQIDEMSKQDDLKRVQIEKLKKNHEEIMNSLEKICRDEESEDQPSQLNGIKEIFSNQLEKLREDYDIEILTKKNSIVDLKIENQKIRQQLKQSLEMEKSLKMENQTYLQRIRQLQQAKLKKVTLSTQVQEEISYLRRQLVSVTKQLELKEIKIKQLNLYLRQSKISHIKIDVVNEDDQNAYLVELKELIHYYEKITMSHHKTINQLQQSLYDFMEDAIAKENELQKVDEQLSNLKQSYRGEVIEKMRLQKDNTRLKKMISSSEKKITAMGSKLTDGVFKYDEISLNKKERRKLIYGEQPQKTVKID